MWISHKCCLIIVQSATLMRCAYWRRRLLSFKVDLHARVRVVFLSSLWHHTHGMMARSASVEKVPRACSSEPRVLECVRAIIRLATVLGGVPASLTNNNVALSEYKRRRWAPYEYAGDGGWRISKLRSWRKIHHTCTPHRSDTIIRYSTEHLQSHHTVSISEAYSWLTVSLVH